MARYVSISFTASRLAVVQPSSCSSFRLPWQARPMVQHVVRGACDGEHTSEERLSRLARYSHRNPRLNKTRLRDAMMIRFRTTLKQN
jgi:hypothetical protein